MRSNTNQHGFTIVELLIVVVIIAILAAITVVTYTGIQARARASAVSSSLSQAKKKLELYKVDNTTYPATGSLASAGITDSNDTTYQYTATNSNTSFCLTATTATTSYYINDTTASSPTAGGCPGHGVGGNSAITNLVVNPNAETNTTGWVARLSATISRTTTEYHTGTSSLMVTTPGAVTDEGLNLNTTLAQSSGVAGIHTASAWVKAPSGAQLRIIIEDYTSANVYIGGTVVVFTGTGAWQRVSASRSTATTTNKFVLDVRTNTTQAVTYYVDDAMITQSSTLYNYADGSSPSWVWNGTINASTSTGPAL